MTLDAILEQLGNVIEHEIEPDVDLFALRLFEIHYDTEAFEKTAAFLFAKSPRDAFGFLYNELGITFGETIKKVYSVNEYPIKPGYVKENNVND